MLTGERRPVSARRGMTVLGKIPAVPKPINLPSQRLENRGLDPNVEIVPRGSVSWGAAGRSPPASSSPWGNSTQSSSPPVSSGPLGGAPPRPATAGGNVPSTGSTGLSTGGNGGPWGGNAPRPSSAGSGTRPSSAGSMRQTQEALAAVNAWGPATARPSSASGVLGQAQPQAPVVRPRSAETRTLSTQAPALTRFAEQTNGQAAPPPTAWGGAGAARKLNEEPHQPSRFMLTRVDFPSLGSEKNPDLRPQQNKTGSSPPERPTTVDERVPLVEEQPAAGPAGPHDELPPTSTGAYGGQERMPEGWRREVRPYGGHPGMAEGSWHTRDGPPMQPFGGGQPQGADTWRRDSGHGAAPGGGPSDDNWRRGGPPVGPYGPPGPGRFQPDPAGFMHQQRYGPGPGPGLYGRGGGPGPGGYGRHGDVYGNAGPFGRPGGAPPRPGPPMGPGMYQGPYDNYYGPPGPGYGNMDEREMLMLGMNGPPGMYGNFPQGPPGEPFGRYPHGGPLPGPRHMPNNPGMSRERNDSLGYEGEGYREGAKYKDNSNFKDGGGFSKEGGRLSTYQDPAESRRVDQVMSSTLTSEMQRPSSRGGHHGTHRDWGAAASSDEPMDFSKPVFEEDVSSASPSLSNKQALPVSPVDSDTIHIHGDGKPVEQLKIEDAIEDVGLSQDKVKGLVDIGEVKDSVAVHAPKSNSVTKDDHVQTRKQKEVDSGVPVPKSRGEDTSTPGAKDQLVRKGPLLESTEPSEKRWGKDARISAQTTRERGFGREHVFSPHGGRGVGAKKESNPASTVAIPVATHTVRPGQSVSGILNNRPTTASVLQGPLSSSAPEPVVTEEVASPSVHEKHSHSNSHVSDPTSPSGSDGQKSSDKLRILKRVGDGGLECPPSDSVNTTEISQTEVLIAAATTMEPVLKDDSKTRSKPVNSHDGEKEWRPKVPPVADIAVEVSPSTAGLTLPATPTVSAELSGALGGATSATDKTGLASGNVDSVDYYDSQRAKMKEIAAQRAIQLRKEEEERIKEQKAKALAKLEELNRRSLTVPVSQLSEEPAVDDAPGGPSSVIAQREEVEVVSVEVSIDEVRVAENIIGGTGVSTPRNGVRNGKNEHGKRERIGDRKGNGRGREEQRVKIGSGEHRESAKGRLSTSASQVKMEPPLLPPPSQQSPTPQALLPSPSGGLATSVPESPAIVPPETSNSLISHLQQQVPPKLQEPRHRGKQHALQQKQAARQNQSPVEAEQPSLAREGPADITDKIGGWPVGSNSPLDIDSKESTVVVPTSVANADVAAAVRKRKSKNSGRNKQKLEGLTIPSDGPSGVEHIQGWTVDLSSPNDSGTEVGRPIRHAVVPSGVDDAVKAKPSLVSQKQLVPQDPKPESAAVEQSAVVESVGSDVGSFRSNGDVPSKKPQRKPQTARRVPARERGISQDVRVGDKPHGGEAMIWAPVRSPSGSHPAGPKGGFGSDIMATGETVGERKEEVVVPQIAVVPPTSRARRAELERYTPKPVVKQHAQQQEELQQQQGAPSVIPLQRNESSNVSPSSAVPQSSSTLPETKFGSEGWQGDSSVKQSRSHTSWRQRSSGSERGSTPKDAQQVQRSESTEAGGKFQQANYNNQTHQNYHRNRPLSNATSEQYRSGSSHQAKPDAGQGNRHQTSTSVAEKEQQQVEAPQQACSPHSNVPILAPAASEKEQKISQEGVTPYQPPRPGSSQKIRGLESDVQSSHEHPRSHRANVSQGDRQHGAPAKFDRDHNSHERGLGSQQSRSHSSRHHGPPGSHDKDMLQPHSGSHQQQRSAPVQPSASEGASIPREKEQLNSHTVGTGQAKPISRSLHGQHVAPVLTQREPSRAENVVSHQPRSPVRQRTRQQAVPHEKELTAPGSHAHQQPRSRQPGHEREHNREVPNAVHHQQQQRGASEGHWQQTGGVVLSERTQANSDHGQSYDHPTRSTSHKSQTTSNASVDRDHAATQVGSHENSRSESQNKPQGPASSDFQKQPQYQPVPQSQKTQQQPGSHGPKLDNAHNSLHWHGERGGSPPALRGREHGHARRGRYGGRYSGPGTGRSGEGDNRREQLSKQRLSIDAAGSAVPSQVGG